MAQLPAEALPIILALLPAQSLGRAACVCSAWRAAAATPALWRAAYAALFIPDDAAALRRAAALAGTEMDWRASVRDRFVAGTGWRTGRCAVRQLASSASGAEHVTLLDDHLLAFRPDGVLDVYALAKEATAAPAQPTQLLGGHSGALLGCSGDAGSGLVLTASEGAACVWRSAACMARRGERSLLATLRVQDNASIDVAWLLPEHHIGASAFRGGSHAAR